MPRVPFNPSQVYQGNALRFRSAFKDKDGVAEDPTNVTFYLKDDAGDVILAVTLASLTHVSTGVYQYIYYVEPTATPSRYYAGFYGQNAQNEPYAYDERWFRVLQARART